jgi:starch synthase
VPNADRKPLKILFLAAEAAPLVKVGGLADVAGALPAELRKLGHDVRVILPLQPGLRGKVAGAEPAFRPSVPARSSAMQAEAYAIDLNGVPAYLIDGPPLRASGSVYHADSGRDAPKYVFFSLAALELARMMDWKPDLVHTNDWHTAAAGLWLAGPGRRDRFYKDMRSILTIHNLPYLGQDAGWALAQFSLSVPDQQPAAGRFDALPGWAFTALLPLGIAAADRIVAVSLSYAEEILTPAFGAGLDRYLGTQADRISGILNGLDSAVWNPAADPHLIRTFDPTSLALRKENKAALQKRMHLDPDPALPLIGMVGRLSEQKGIDLALPALGCWCGRGNQAAILGRGDPRLEQQCHAFAARHSGRAAAEIGFDEELASLMYGGTDFLLVPSRYEPCGISQMIAMRYGSVPIVRAVGGLKDTVRDLAGPEGTGLVFAEASAPAVALALGRAEEIVTQGERMAAAQANGMAKDFEWRQAAEEYLAVYRRALSAQPPE